MRARKNGGAFELQAANSDNLEPIFRFSIQFSPKLEKAAPLKVKSSSISFYFPTESVYWTFYVFFMTPARRFESIWKPLEYNFD